MSAEAHDPDAAFRLVDPRDIGKFPHSLTHPFLLSASATDQTSGMCFFPSDVAD